MGKVAEITMYQTTDGSVWHNKAGADAHEDKLEIAEHLHGAFFEDMEEALPAAEAIMRKFVLIPKKDGRRPINPNTIMFEFGKGCECDGIPDEHTMSITDCLVEGFPKCQFCGNVYVVVDEYETVE